MQDDIETLERNVQNISTSLSKLMESASEPFVSQLDSKHKALMSKWEKAVKGAKDHNLSLKNAHEKTQLVRL